MTIHPLAVVNPHAQLGHDVEVGPFCVIEADTVIGDGCRLEARVCIRSGTRMGENNHVCEGSVIGGPPQHIQRPAEIGGVEIGSHNTFRENVTIHRAMKPGHDTTLGDHNYVMVNAHFAHDCVIGSHTICANNVMLGGHVTVDDRAYISGGVAVHQFSRIGKFAMVGGQAHVVRDIPPYVTIDGATTMVVGLNLVGLRRNGFTPADVAQLKAAYRLIYRSGLQWREILNRLASEFSTGPAALFYPFLAHGKRGFVQERRGPVPATIKLAEAVDERDVREEPLRKMAG